MLKAKAIQPSSAEWGSVGFLVPKPDGSLRFCLDRQLNNFSKKDRNAVPLSKECVYPIEDAEFFPTPDCNSGFWKIKIDEASIDKISFGDHVIFSASHRYPLHYRTLQRPSSGL